MKISLLAFLCASGVFLAGCSKPEDLPAPSAAPSATAPAAQVETSQQSASATAAELQKQAAAGQAALETAANDAAKSLESTTTIKPAEVPPPSVPAAPAAQANVQTIFDDVKSLISEKKYPEALAALTQLSSTSLSAEQQRLVEQLKTQVQNAMAAQAGNEGLKSVGGLLKRNN
jgi:hypothetical protein